jgi:rhodanese-related sulfurtransferase
VKVFHAGLPAWKKAGELVVTEPAAVERRLKEGEPFVLVDLRDPAAAEGGFIPGAAGVPAARLASWKARFPEDRKAPVVLYDAGETSPAAFATVRGWGFVNASVLAGGRAAWKGEVRTGPLATRLEYVKRLKPGEIGIDEFRKIAAARPKGTAILDVREQPVDGVLPGALAIPESQLASRAGEVPTDRDVVIHCNTGILAKKAYDLLAGKGHARARWLNAVVVIGANGSYDVTEK